jgi:hypothetical protein
VEIMDFLAEKFKKRFSDFLSHDTNIGLLFFENLFSVEVGGDTA